MLGFASITNPWAELACTGNDVVWAEQARMGNGVGMG
jgi:hypothetical protein